MTNREDPPAVCADCKSPALEHPDALLCLPCAERVRAFVKKWTVDATEMDREAIRFETKCSRIRHCMDCKQVRRIDSNALCKPCREVRRIRRDARLAGAVD